MDEYYGILLMKDGQKAILSKIGDTYQAWVVEDFDGTTEEEARAFMEDSDNDTDGWCITADSLGGVMENLID